MQSHTKYNGRWSLSDRSIYRSRIQERTIEILELLTATLIVFPFLIFYVANDVILVVP